MLDTISFSSTNNLTLPIANQYCILIDSTRFLLPGRTANSTSLVSTAGTDRGTLAGARIEGSILCTIENLTLVRQILSGTGSTWETVANTTEINGSQTVTAGTTLPLRWVPSNPDFRMYILAGATPPTAIDYNFMVILGDRAAVS